MNKDKISIDEAIYGLVWCTAAADFKRWGLIDGKIIADQELAYLQYIAIEKKLIHLPLVGISIVNMR